MARYARSTRIDAPLEEVWAFHSRAEGLEALTPGFLNLTVERIEGPDGELDPDELEAGTSMYMNTRPFGVLPAQPWVAKIVERHRADDSAYFVDEMAEGPFPEWRHTHKFAADGDGTLMEDEVHYRLPGGVFGDLATPFGGVGFEPMFRYRHWQTKRLLE
jgi:ligand-binding SRPBCC domain-containing protein